MNQNTETKYFNINTTGMGYLNNPREHSKGHGFTVTVQALRGNAQDPEKSRLDLDVKGTEALKLVKHLVTKYPALLSKDKNVQKPVVFIGFMASDIRADTFESHGKTISSIKGRLLRIDFITINGERVYEADKKDTQITEVDEAAPEKEVAPVEAKAAEATEVVKEPEQAVQPTAQPEPQTTDPF